MRFSLLPLALLATAPILHARPSEPALLVQQLSGETRPSRVRTLAVVLHGDGDASIAQAYGFAAATARTLPASAAITLLRPGYADSNGRRSPGDRGRGNGDGYTRMHVGEVARTLIHLRKRYRRANIILVGEGGGAALAANLVGIYPTLADGLLLLSCPCALPEWRREMAKKAPGDGFGQPVASLDPLQTIGGVPATLRAAMLVGSDDPVTMPTFSRTYAEALALRGVAVDYRIVPGRSANQLLTDPEVAAALQRLSASLPAKRR